MSKPYYEQRDLEDFPNIGEYAPEPGAKFSEYYTTATSAGKLTEREKALIALAVALSDTAPIALTPIRTNASHWVWATTK